MEKVLHVESVNDYARYVGAPELHPHVQKRVRRCAQQSWLREVIPAEGGGKFATRCIILIFGEFDNFLRKIDNGMFGKNTELCSS